MVASQDHSILAHRQEQRTRRDLWRLVVDVL
jgi:hypothetical protein